MSNSQNDHRAKYMNAMSGLEVVEHDGVIQKVCWLEWMLAIKTVRVRPSDVFVCGYPKSGITWLQEIVCRIVSDGVVGRDGHRIVDDVMATKNNHLSSFETLDNPRIVSTHFEAKYLPSFATIDCKVIYIVRNPKDVCVSYYHFHKMLKEYGSGVDWDDFCHLFLSGQLLTGDWLSHVNDYWLTYGTRNHPNVLFIAYEELCADLTAMVGTIGRFLGKQLTAETVANIAVKCTADAMRDSFINPPEFRSNSQFIREAKVGDWKRHMTEHMSALFDKRYGDGLRAIGLPVCDHMEGAIEYMSKTGRIIQRN